MISIIIPTYNEGANIGPLIRRIFTVLGKRKEPLEIVVVDDHSLDGTVKGVKKLGLRNVMIMERPAKMGIASAVMDGAKKARGEKIVVMDADFSHPPEKVPELLAALERADIAIGSRHLPGGGVEEWPWHRRILSDGAGLLSRLVIRQKVTDPMGGFFAVRRDLLLRTPLRVKGYKILMNILAKNPRATVKEVPYLFQNRKVGKSKLGIREIGTFLLDMIRLL